MTYYKFVMSQCKTTLVYYKFVNYQCNLTFSVFLDITKEAAYLVNSLLIKSV